jgi:tRNA (cmo5U34)-methyltransferase
MKEIADYFNEEAKTHDYLFVQQMGMKEFYDEIESQLVKISPKYEILVLGAGTGLEIERITWNSNVTAIDISSEMLRELNKKKLHPEVSLNTICSSFLEMNFGLGVYDIVLTCYTMHHFNEKQKINLYRCIWKSLKSGGVFINGDSMVNTNEEEWNGLLEAEKIYNENNKPFGSLHIDVPFCLEHELKVLKNAGFKDIILEREWTKTKLYKAIKEEGPEG